MRHETYHGVEAQQGYVPVGCKDCGWREMVPVVRMSWIEAMTKIYEVRDNHEVMTKIYEVRDNHEAETRDQS